MTDRSRLDTLRRMLDKEPGDVRALFGLALEYEKMAAWEDAASVLRRYLSLTEDEGNAYGRLGRALRELGREEEARDAYREGIAAAYRHNHPTMAMEFEEVLEEM